MSKIIAITGAGEGLGKALARRFCADGDKVAILGRTFSKLEAAAEEFGENCLPVQCDIADEASVEAAFAKIAEAFGKLDVVINNAAIYAPFELQEAKGEDLMAAFATNCVGPALVAREAQALMGPGGHVINVTSESITVPIPMMWAYAATKTAVERMSDGWRSELRPKGIRVTNIRAGKMYGEGKTGSGWAPELTMRFAQACADAGMPMMEQPMTNFQSLPDIFRMVVDSPADLNLDHITLGGRRPD